jgi:RecG-like helicase
VKENYPETYRDFIKPISELTRDLDNISFFGRVVNTKVMPFGDSKSLTHVTVIDESEAKINITFFEQPVHRVIKVGSSILIIGNKNSYAY